MSRHGLPLLLAALTLSGCPRASTIAPLTDGGSAPTAAEVLDRARSRPIARSLQGTTRVKLTTPRKSARLRGVLVINAPEQLRAEALSMVGQPVAYLVSGPGSLVLFSPYSSLYMTSRNPAAVLGKLAGGVLSTPDLLGLFLGQVPPCAPQGRSGLTVSETALTVPCYQDGRVVRTLDFDPVNLRLTRVQGQSEAGGEFTMTLGDHRPLEGVEIPHVIQLQAPAAGLAVDFEYEEVAVNIPPDPGLFTLVVPGGLVEKDFEEVLAGMAPPPTLTPSEPAAPAPPLAPPAEPQPAPDSGIAP